MKQEYYKQPCLKIQSHSYMYKRQLVGEFDSLYYLKSFVKFRNMPCCHHVEFVLHLTPLASDWM